MSRRLTSQKKTQGISDFTPSKPKEGEWPGSKQAGISLPVDCRGCTANLLSSVQHGIFWLSGERTGEVHFRPNFWAILSPPSKESVPDFLRFLTKKKDLSLEEIQKLEAAKEWGKSHEADVQKQLAEKWEHEKEVLQKVIEANNNFSKMTEKKPTHKTEANREPGGRDCWQAGMFVRRTSALKRCRRTNNPKTLPMRWKLTNLL